MCKIRPAKRAVKVAIGLFILMIPLAACTGDVPGAVLKATDSVVLIESGTGSDASTGTGFIIYKNQRSTYFATNYHVVADAENAIYVWVAKSYREKANVIAESAAQDLAVLRIGVTMDAQPLILNANYRQGEEVYAIGFPTGADALSDTTARVGSEATITNGLISSVRNVSLTDGSSPARLLQINAAINPGNSGGPLLNVKGQVVGINSYGVVDTQGINGAIAADELISLVNTQKLLELPHSVSWEWYAAAAAMACVLALVIRRLVKKARKNAALEKKIPLPQYLERLGNPLDIASATGILMPVALDIKHMHEQGSVFLRLYPGGLSMTRNGCVINGNQESPSDAFVAPEQKKWAFPGVRADVYAFCAVLHYILRFCREPDENLQEAEMRAKMTQVLEKGLSESPDDRFQSMQELITALAPFNAGISGEALKPFAGQQAKKKNET